MINIGFVGLLKPEEKIISEAKSIEQLARELHEKDSNKVGHSIMVGASGIFNVSGPSWDEFSEEVREHYRAEAREILAKK